MSGSDANTAPLIEELHDLNAEDAIARIRVHAGPQDELLELIEWERVHPKFGPAGRKTVIDALQDRIGELVEAEKAAAAAPVTNAEPVRTPAPEPAEEMGPPADAKSAREVAQQLLAERPSITPSALLGEARPGKVRPGSVEHHLQAVGVEAVAVELERLQRGRRLRYKDGTGNVYENVAIEKSEPLAAGGERATFTLDKGLPTEQPVTADRAPADGPWPAGTWVEVDA